MRELFQQDPASIVGLDGSAEAVQVAKGINPSSSFTVGDVLALPFPDQSFDLVICLEVLEHLEHPSRGLAELHRVARKRLLLSVPDEPLFRGANFVRGKNLRALGNDPGHVNHWSSRAFVHFVSAQCPVEAVRRSFPWTLVLCRVD